MDTALTVDVDMMDYGTGQPLDEMGAVFPRLCEAFAAFPHIRTTWFFRIDSHMAALFGDEAFLFNRYGLEMDRLRSEGHEIGWHFHGYRQARGQWQQNLDEAEICEELQRYGEMARKRGLRYVRMGWAFHTNRTMNIVNDLGFEADSSGLPGRRSAGSAPSSANWINTPQDPYQPSVCDYRIPGDPHLGIWEVPISTTGLCVSSDRDGNAVRYINPAYRSDIFERALESVHQRRSIVLICHPYELIDKGGQHPLLAFDYREFMRNLELLERLQCDFCTLKEMVP